MAKMTINFQLLLILLGICGMWQMTDGWTLGKPVITAPPAATAKSVVDIFCELYESPEGLSIDYHLFKEGDFQKAIGHYTAHSREEAKFPMLVSNVYDGYLICNASGHNNTDVTPTYSDPVRFRVIEKVQGAYILLDPDLEVLWEGERVTLNCSVTTGTYISYKWFLNNMPVQHRYNSSQGQLTIESISINDSGNYTCVASNQFNGTEYSRSIFEDKSVKVKEHVSDPQISLRVVKDVDGNFNALVTCQSEKGPSSVNFIFFRDNNKVAEKEVSVLHAVFNVSIQLDQDMGLVHCQASDGSRTVQSEPLLLKVESVGGPVKMNLINTIKRDLEITGVSLQCSVEKGTFPEYSWFFNNTRLENGKNPSHWSSGPVLAFMLIPKTAGIYHCEAANAFDQTTRVRSEKRLINKAVLNRVPLHVVIIVFTCVVLLIVAVTACCLYGLVLRKRKIFKYRDLHFTEMSNIADEVESTDEYGEEDDEGLVADGYAYEEDMDVVESSRIDDSEDSDEYEEEDEMNVQEEETSIQDEETDVQTGTETEQ